MSPKPPIAAALRELLEEGVRRGAFEHGHAWVAQGGRRRAQAWTAGCRAHSLWDVASLTKPMATVTPLMRAVAAGAMSLEEEVRLPEGLVTSVEALLAHRSGLPAWDDLWAVAEATGEPWRPGSPAVKAAVSRRIGTLAGHAEGTVYSDLGFITLGWHMEARLGRNLRALTPRWRWGVDRGTRAHARAIPTGHCPRRQRQAHGEVDDLNCWVLGGVAGHAGLFASANEVGAWALDLSNAAAGRGGEIDGGVIRHFWDLERRDGRGGTWVLGWDTPTPPNSTAGTQVSPHAVGHLGFTGTSVWIDREADLIVVMLTNRVALGEASRPIMRQFRPHFHDAIRARLGH